jgi:hypothetical protein
VIDCGWQELEKKLTSEGGDLDSLIDAHNAYLDRLVSKGLLLSSRVGKEVRPFLNMRYPHIVPPHTPSSLFSFPSEHLSGARGRMFQSDPRVQELDCT